MDRVELGEDLESVVRDLVATGRYASVDAVVREGLRLPEAREHGRAALDVAIDAGPADSRAGRLKPMDEVFDRVEARLLGSQG